MRSSTKNSPIKLNIVEIKLTRWFVYKWKKPTRQKTSLGDFKVTTLENPLLSNKQLQVKESQYLIPTYSWTLTPIPNWTCSVVTISPFQCTAPSMWLTNRCADPSTRLHHQLEKDVGSKVLQFITQWRSWSSLVTKPYGVQLQQLLQEKDELWQILSPVTICMNKLFYTLLQLM